MKPCSKNRRLIAWLVLGVLEARKASALREHLAACEGCRCYLEEMSCVNERLAAVKPDSDIQASEFFHQRVAEKLEAVESGSALENLAGFVRRTMLEWRIALPVTAALLIVAFALIKFQAQHRPTLSAPPAVQVTSAANPENDLAPTLANYQRVASQSLGKLDELLTEQGNKALPPAPVYTASTFRLANASF